jgi:plasmid stability protein
MAQLLVRNLDANTINYLKNRAKNHHRSLQGEVKSILEQVAKMSSEKISDDVWPANFCEQILGGWKGEPLERSPQGEFGTRDELE